MIILNTLRILLIACTIFSNFAYAEIKKDGFVIKSGLMKKVNNDEYVVYKETTEIPYITESVDPDFTFGYTLHTESNAIFYHYAVIDMPMLNAISGDFIGANVTQKNRISARTQELPNVSYGYFSSSLDDDDPPGIYIMSVFINDKLLHTIEFHVLTPVE